MEASAKRVIEVWHVESNQVRIAKIMMEIRDFFNRRKYARRFPEAWEFFASLNLIYLTIVASKVDFFRT